MFSESFILPKQIQDLKKAKGTAKKKAAAPKNAAKRSSSKTSRSRST